MENQLSELWSIMEFANPGLLGPAKAFREQYAVPVERFGDEEAAQRLRRVTQPFLLRRLKTDKSIISDLPDKQEIKVWCNLTQEQASLYQATVTDMLSRIDEASDDITRRGLVLATMTKLKQVCNHPAHLLGDGSRARPYQSHRGAAAHHRAVAPGRVRARPRPVPGQPPAGEMPQEIEEVFGGCGTPLFPRLASDLDMRCSCPDWEVPCKHLAAVCYVLAEEFDRDPFAMLAWRGQGRDELLAALRRVRAPGSGPAPGPLAVGGPVTPGPAVGRWAARHFGFHPHGQRPRRRRCRSPRRSFLVRPAEPGPGVWPRRPAPPLRPAAAHVPAAAGQGQGPGPGRRAGPYRRLARRIRVSNDLAGLAS